MTEMMRDCVMKRLGIVAFTEKPRPPEEDRMTRSSKTTCGLACTSNAMSRARSAHILEAVEESLRCAD